MAIDEDNDDGLGGRSRDRREFTEANRWGRPLVALDPIELAAAPIPDEIRDEVLLGRELAGPVGERPRSRSYVARDRQFRRIDGLVRLLEPEQIAAIDAYLKDPRAAWKGLDGWCDRIVAEGDPALDAWIGEHPDADRQRLRTLARQARKGGAEARKVLWNALREHATPTR